jgi:hypothetical protein
MGNFFCIGNLAESSSINILNKSLIENFKNKQSTEYDAPKTI